MSAPPTLREIFAGATWKVRARLVVDLATPWGVHWLRDTARKRRAIGRIEAGRRTQALAPDRRYEEAVAFLLDRGLDEREVREGSMPQASLEYVAGILGERLRTDRPLAALHVGNFVGVSLCWLSWYLRDLNADSVVVSVDPNVSHRGIDAPQQLVLALLHHFGLLDSNLIVPGWTLEGDALEGLACENALTSLGRVAPRRFDLVLLDGNHEEEHLERELTAVRGLLADDGVVVFDDVDERTFAGIVRVFERALADESFAGLGQNGRVGLLQLTGKAL